MKRSAFILFLLLGFTNISFSQKYAFVDVKTILEIVIKDNLESTIFLKYDSIKTLACQVCI